MTLTLESIIDKVRAKVYSKYRTRSDVDDLMQEASVLAWRKHSETDWDDAKVIYHAARKADSLVSGKSGEVPTGKPVNYTKRTQSTGDASREKLRAYLTEYEKIHGEAPTNAHVAKALGMNYNNVRYHRNRLHLFDGEVNKRSAYVLSLSEGLDALNNDSQDVPGWMFQLPSEELNTEALDTKIDVRRAIAKTLNDRDKRFLFLEFWLDKSYVDIGKELGFSGAYATKMHRRILAKVGEELK